jgi:Flp pilus assembly protein TadD
MLRGLALAGLVATLSACGNTARKPDRPAPAPSSAPTATAEQPAVPDKGDPEARFKQALDLMKSRKSAEAEAAFLALAQDFPEYSGPPTNLGILYAKSNRRDVAISAFTKAATNNPQNAAAFNWLGILYRESGNYPRAQQAYEKALEVQPNNPAAHLNLGILLGEYMKQPAQALPHYRLYLQQYGKEDLRVLAWIAEIEAAQKASEASAAPAAAPTGTGVTP